MTDPAKAPTHVNDAAVAVAAFREALPDPTTANAVSAERPLSLLPAALVWSGWSDDLKLLHAPCLVIKAAAQAAVEAERTSADGVATPADPSLLRERTEIGARSSGSRGSSMSRT